MKIYYECEVCGKFFEGEEECLEHERGCNEIVTFLCYKCGKVIKWNKDDPWAFAKENQCHNINLGKMGYGSKLDGSIVDFDICDNCLSEFIDSFRYKDDVLEKHMHSFLLKNENNKVNTNE